MGEYFNGKQAWQDSPASYAFAITPADSDLTVIPRSLYIGTSGDIVITDMAGTVTTFVGVSGWVPMRVIRIAAASTASDIV